MRSTGSATVACASMTRTLERTPAADGFHMPAEFAQVARAIAQFEPVTVGVSRAQFTAARAALDDDVRVVEMAHDDAWMRDVGPTCVVNRRGQVRGVDWHFNAWGGL